ncbi:MAG TPA: nucleoside kinase [Candidatus Caccovicinus merdipullorum]|uniref:Nucleoside kinase n=1 Tax=Candidatus Caccovicinus merdipullorum TaxID=2840724 RepID=A0A9D1GK16_9FIRM|nr:nucleoside kinase [Candidatus Caccovicinus merdipullorum]
MVRIVINGEKKEYPFGTTWQTVAQEYQPEWEDDILLVQADGKLQELHKKAAECSELRFITARDGAGRLTYRRSLTFLMLKAFYDVAGVRHIKKLTVDFSLGNGLFVNPSLDFSLTQEILNQVKEKMQEYVAQKIPIMKRNMPSSEAIELFHKHGMYDKERLFRYRRVSSVNVYSIGGFEDYFYGYMVQNTGYLKYFDLVLYQNGFVLLYPQNDPKKVDPFVPKDKLFHVLSETSKWGERLNLANVGSLNDRISQGKASETILIEEALMEKRIGEIASRIAAEPSKKLVMIAGPSSSGKTTFSHRLSIQLMAMGLKPHPIAVDDYFVNRVDSPRDENGNYNYEALECLDVKLFNEDMTKLLAGEKVELPRYNFITGVREYKGDYLTLGPEDILVIEGIHCLNDKLSYSLPKENKFKIYISALTSLNIDEHNRVPTADGRLIRRMVRDARTRGASAQDTIRMWNSVRRGEEENIFPYQEEADVMFNSALVYELAVLKQYAEPILFGIPADSPEYTEAKRLLKFLDYFLGVSSEDVPKNSILREFIGGSCFRV